ncbi:MAG: hypothetical protein LBK41_01735 [Clostridiales bacterium]|jgi:phenylpyruvate tautomerase PptA (4-oxalocrotonate tautomerase family)|nr:hypothetical protein [Clostridiales bacterium]
MPYIEAKLSAPLGADKKAALKAAFGEAISLLPGKSERWLMVGIDDGYDLWLAGEDGPAAMIEVAAFGRIDPAASGRLTAAITRAVSEQTGAPPSRIYVKYSETEFWGFNGSNL